MGPGKNARGPGHITVPLFQGHGWEQHGRPLARLNGNRNVSAGGRAGCAMVLDNRNKITLNRNAGGGGGARPAGTAGKGSGECSTRSQGFLVTSAFLLSPAFYFLQSKSRF